MSKLGDRLNKAKSAPRPQRELTVLIDQDLIERRDELVARLQAIPAVEASDERLAEADPNQPQRDAIIAEMAKLDEESEDALLELQITKAIGSDWSATAAKYPPRDKVILDNNWGLDLHGLVQNEGYRWIQYRDGDTWKHFEYNEGEGDYDPVDEWKDLCEVISGFDSTRIANAVFDLNVWGPQQRRDSLGKVLASKRA